MEGCQTHDEMLFIHLKRGIVRPKRDLETARILNKMPLQFGMIQGSLIQSQF